MSRPGPLLIRLGQAALVGMFVLLIVHFLRKYSADLSVVLRLKLADILLIGFWLFLSYIAYAYGVFLILKRHGLEKLTLFGWIRIYIASRFVNFFVIQGGNLFRTLVLKKRYGFSYANSIGVNVMLIWLNAAVALTLCGSGLMLVELVDPAVRWRIWVAVLLFWLAPFAGFLFLKGVRQLPDGVAWVREHLLSAAAVFSTTLARPVLAGGLVFLSAMHFFAFIGVNYTAFHALGNDVGLVETLVFTTAVSFTRYINIVPGNIGLSELVGGLVSQTLGTGFGDGLIIVGLVRVIELLMIVAIALLDGNAQIFSFLKDRKSVETG